MVEFGKIGAFTLTIHNVKLVNIQSMVCLQRNVAKVLGLVSGCPENIVGKGLLAFSPLSTSFILV